MIETLIITILGNLIVLGLSVGIIAIYWKKKSEQMENNDGELPIQDIFSEFLLQSQEVFKKELLSEPVQVLITTSVIEGITALFAEEQNQKMLNNFITGIFNESISGIMPQYTGAEPLTETDKKSMNDKTEKALGGMTVNTIMESLPPGYNFLLDKIYPNWQEDAMNRPRDFLALVSKANEWGLFNLIPGLSQGKQTVVQNTQSSGF